MKTRELYNKQADNWKRHEPRSLSDFTGRPAIFEMIGKIPNSTVLDLGCGEGYCTRTIKTLGAGSVLGIDISEAMIEAARSTEEENPLGIEYRTGDVRNMDFQAESFDLVTAVFVFNYISFDDMVEIFKVTKKLLNPGGRFIFSVPHPSFSFIRKEKSPPFFFETNNHGYFSAKGREFSGEIYTIDGIPLNVSMIHKTLEDYFTAFHAAGFERMPTVRELRVSDDQLAKDPEFFSKVFDFPLHLGFEVTK